MDQQLALKLLSPQAAARTKPRYPSSARTTRHAKGSYIANLILLLISVGASAIATVLGYFGWPSNIIGLDSNVVRLCNVTSDHI